MGASRPTQAAPLPAQTAEPTPYAPLHVIEPAEEFSTQPLTTATPVMAVRDADGKQILALFRRGRNSYRLAGGTRVEIKINRDTAWAVDSYGRERVGARRNDEDALLRLVNRSGVSTLFLRSDGRQWRGEDPDGGLRWVIKGFNGSLQMYDHEGRLLGTVRGGNNRTTITDGDGNLVFTLTKLEPLAAALWYLNRHNPYAAAALLGAFATW